MKCTEAICHISGEDVTRLQNAFRTFWSCLYFRVIARSNRLRVPCISFLDLNFEIKVFRLEQPSSWLFRETSEQNDTGQYDSNSEQELETLAIKN